MFLILNVECSDGGPLAHPRVAPGNVHPALAPQSTSVLARLLRGLIVFLGALATDGPLALNENSGKPKILSTVRILNDWPIA
jgi:hypothetical protein